MKAGWLRTSFGETTLRFSRCCRVAEGRDRDRAVRLAPDQELAVDRAVIVEKIQDVGEGAGNVVAGARVKPPHAAFAHRLHADAVPFPLRRIVAGGELRKVRLVERLRQHHRAERGERGGDRALAPPLQPGEEFDIGRHQAVPDFLDLDHILLAEAGERLLGEPRRDAHAQRAGDDLQERVAAG